MMDQSTPITKLFRALQFRKHVKELTSACKRINKDACYEFVTYRHGIQRDTLFTQKKSTKFNILCSKIHNYKQRSKSSCRLSTRIRPKTESSSSSSSAAAATTTTTTTTRTVQNNNEQPFEQLAHATSTSPANLSMIVKQSYKPLHAKSTQFNKNTIAVTKGTPVKALYAISNWVFIEIIETCQTGFVPAYCLRISNASLESSSQNNLSLLNVSIYEKPHPNVNASTSSQPGRFISSIGPCHFNIEQASLTCSRINKSGTYTRHYKDQSNLSRQISNISLHAYDHDAYGTLNLTPCKSLSFSVLDSEPIVHHLNTRLRVMENYQRQFVGDISVLESEVVTLVNTTQSDNDWRFVRRGDGRQGYIPKQIVLLDRNFN
ncbi:unnamed protein product [Rotaria socialis]|uniref:SH3 domain-containing protein n=1 Tax=Rotaria socialis TaxID=392032 RepID=A0A818HTJ3_9BILA|nr:unnamed protein product [Rotaria socialis]CAF4750367.1 unnamed protein product [Rotaria socialis]